MSQLATRGVAAALVVTMGAGIGVAIDRSGGGAGDRADVVAPLSAADRAALTADRGLIESIPEALSEVPEAAADVAGTSPASAEGQLAGVSALQPLVAAISGRASAVPLLVSSYQALLGGRALANEASVPQALATLQAIEGDIIPALRVVALRNGLHIDASAAYAVVERDPKTAVLARFLAQWSSTYGAFLLMEQKALS